MKQTLAAAALLIAIPMFASEVAVKVELSDSLRAAVKRGDVKVRVSDERRAYDAGESAPVVIRDVSPGKVKLRALISTNHGNWVDDPKGVEVDVPRDGQAVVTLPVTSRMISGSVALHGKPLRGDLHLFPSDPNRDNWGFAVPIDDAGTFAFPLPHGGAWDLQISWGNRKWTVQIPRFEFRNDDVHIDLPAGTIAGRVVYDDGKGAVRARLSAVLDRNEKVRAQAIADDDGEFVIDGLGAGTWTVTVDGWKPMQVVLGDGARKDGLVVHLPSSYKYSTKDITAPSKP